MEDASKPRAIEIFNDALERPPTERSAFLQSACAGDVVLRAQVSGLLAAHAEAGEFLASPTQGNNGLIPPNETVELKPLTEGPGTVIGRYKLLQPIGEGGFGVVYMAEQGEPIRRKVALKIIKLGMDTKQVIARFEAERQALALMDHPNIARVLDAGATETGRPYFVMELVKGIPITEYCDRNNLATRERLELFTHVCHAVQHAHQKGIIHRDLKPRNILVTLHDGRPVPKVIDFGIAKATQQPLTEKTMFTEFGQFIGTPVYMSPEQAELSGLDVDTRSDIYSLGVLLYELLTGKTPFDAARLRSAGFSEIQRIIREEEPAKPSTRLSSLGDELTSVAKRRAIEPKKLSTLIQGDLDWIVMKALEKDRTRRYETANEFAKDVERHLQQEPVLAGPPGAGYKLRKFVKRNRVFVTAGSVAVAGVLFGLALSFYGYCQAAWDRDRARQAELVAEQRKCEAQSTTRMLQEMLSSADPGKLHGADYTVRQLLDDFSSGFDERLASACQPTVEAAVRTAIGNTYDALGLYPVAEPHLRKSLEIRRKLLGEDHLDTLTAMYELGIVLHEMGRLAEAEPLYRLSLEKRRRILGEEHPETLKSIDKLSWLFEDQGKLAEAEPLRRQVVEVRRRVLGPEDLWTLTSEGWLAKILVARGKFSEAERVYRATLEIQRRVFGDDHWRTLHTIGYLARALRFAGKLEEAELLYRHSLPKLRKLLGAEHPNLAYILTGLGLILTDTGRAAEAEPMLLEALELRRRRLPAGHWEIAITENALGYCCASLGRFEQAESLLLPSFSCVRQALGEEHVESRDALGHVVQLYETWGKPEKSAEWRAKLVEVNNGKDEP